MQRAAANSAGAPPPRTRGVAGKNQAHAGGPRAYGGSAVVTMRGWRSEVELDTAALTPHVAKAEEGEQKKKKDTYGRFERT